MEVDDAYAIMKTLAQRHEVYRLGYEMGALTREHDLLLEENRRLLVEAALQSSAERLEQEALERLQLRPTEPHQVLHAGER